MPFEVSSGNLVIKDETGTNTLTLQLPVTRQQLIEAAIQIARKAGYSKFILRTDDGREWSEAYQIPDNINDPITVTVVPVNKGA